MNLTGLVSLSRSIRFRSAGVFEAWRRGETRARDLSARKNFAMVSGAPVGAFRNLAKRRVFFRPTTLEPPRKFVGPRLVRLIDERCHQNRCAGCVRRRERKFQTMTP
jgi:hypothetical protein